MINDGLKGIKLKQNINVIYYIYIKVPGYPTISSL